jgi:hypothetical protein
LKIKSYKLQKENAWGEKKAMYREVGAGKNRVNSAASSEGAPLVRISRVEEAHGSGV